MKIAKLALMVVLVVSGQMAFAGDRDLRHTNEMCSKLTYLSGSVDQHCLKKLAGTKYAQKFIDFKNGNLSKALMDELFAQGKLVKRIEEHPGYHDIAGREFVPVNSSDKLALN